VILNTDGLPGNPGDRTSLWQKKVTWVVSHLRVSGGRKESAADLRRASLRLKLAAAAELAEAARRAWLATPKRMRGLVVGRAARISGHLVTCMVYEFKQQPGVFKVQVFDPRGCGTYSLKVSAGTVGKESGVRKKPASWNAEQKRDIVMRWLRGDREGRIQVDPKAGAVELEEGENEQTGEMQVRGDV